jgi:hypothetical protein
MQSGIRMTESSSKNQTRPTRNFLSATIMLGHLCALYDRGVFEAARLMSNLLFQLAVERPTNIPLIHQVGLREMPIIVDSRAQSENLKSENGSNLAGVFFGFRELKPGEMVPQARWIPLFASPDTAESFTALTLQQWLDEVVISIPGHSLSRKQLVCYVRDQDGGAHSDSDQRISKSTAYLELVDNFPMSKKSAIDNQGQITAVWDLLPPFTHALLRQISHEMLSSIYSATDIKHAAPLPTLICFFNGTEMQSACVPMGYPSLGVNNQINGKLPAQVTWPPDGN